MIVRSFAGARPSLGRDVFVAEGAALVGAVTLGDEVSIWYGSVLRGDVARIRIGPQTNVQDLSMVHVGSGGGDTEIGRAVTIGHRAVIHACSIADHVLVGMGALVLDRAVIGPYCLIGAGAVVTPGTRIPEGSLALGMPARVVRPLSEEERRAIEQSAERYVQLARAYEKERAAG